MTHDMKKTLMRMLTLMLLMMVSIGAGAEVKVIYGEKGTELQADKDGKVTLGQKELTGGTIVITQVAQRDGTTKVTLAVTPSDGYTLAKDGLEVYAVAPADISSTRAVTASDKLDLTSDDFKDASQKRTYTTTIDSNLALWLKSASFQTKKREGAKATPEIHPYLGIWYMTVKGNSSHYLVPAANPEVTTAEHVNEDAYFSNNYSTSPGDPEMPFITTYATGKVLNAIWILEPVSDESDYYYIVHAQTGKYLKYQTYISGSDSRRKYVHLETISTLGDTEKFYIVKDGTTDYVKIRPKNSSTLYFNISGGCQDRYNGGTSKPYYSGMLGGYATIDDNSRFLLTNTKLLAPTINYDSEANTFTITYDKIASGFDILYTTDGSTPTVGGSSTQTYSNAPVTVSGSYTLKAVIARYGMVLSELASLPVGIPVDPSITPLTDCNNLVEMSADGAVIYYTLDGSNPDNTSTVYSGPFTLSEDATIKAIAYNGTLHSGITEVSYKPRYTEKPVITQNGITITISGSGTIYYTTDGTAPTIESTPYTDPITLSDGTGTMTIKAAAKESTKELSCVADATISLGYFINDLAKLQDITSHLTERCIVTNDIDASSFTTSITDFAGEFDGSYHTISGLTQPLFSSTNNAVIKNVRLKDVKIEKAGKVGAITGVAGGYTRIYNCGILPSDNKYESPTQSTVKSTDDYCGGLVGHLNDDSRVINCFSYANITGGTTVGGIVGYNQTASTAAVTDGKYANLRTAVVNCMFYGNITGGTNVYPVYGGAKMMNKGDNSINTYDFYRAEASINVPTTNYNCSWPALEENLTRFEYYRYLLNSNRELCGWWVGSNVAPNTLTTAEVQAIKKDASLIGKWVLDPSIAPYPILKPAGKYPSVINPDPARRIDPDTKVWVNRTASANTIETNAAPDTEGQTLGSVTVTVVAGSHHSADNITLSIPITAMDLDNLDFCYGKIQLPYYNEVFGNPTGSTWSAKYGDNYSNMVVTGWDIDTSDGTAGTFSDDPITGNVFADRNSTAKDTHRVFAQGGYYYVPYGVGNITITAHWATAYYLDNGDDYYDRTSFSSSNAGKAFAPAGTRTFESGTFGDQTIFKGSIQGVLSSVTKASTVYDCAIVLVGNHQYKNLKANVSATGNKPFTIMSVDLDFDNEPDYCLEWQIGEGTDRAMIDPVKFDFLPIVELGVAMKEDASTNLFAMGKLTPYGHFEVTETSIIHFGQFEYENVNRTIAAPVILNNGTYDQFSRGTQGDNDQNITYFLVGGHIKMPVFSPGAQVNSNATYWSRHCAVNVLGGEFAKFYLTGNFNNGVTPNKDNPHCYIDGGKLDMVASAAKEGIDGDVYWKIDHASIGEFYGGGINADKRVTGSIDISIDRSKVTKFCGGPMFGDMYDGKTVTTRATGTTFGVYYGAGNGGTSYSQYDRDDNTNSFSMGKYTTYKYQEKINGVEGMNGYHANYELEMVNSSAGTNSNVNYRTYVYAAQFATTNTGNVSSTLTDCRVETNFFGGGNLGGVNGSVTSLLTGHTVVEGSVYGAGYSAKDLSVEILPKEGYTDPSRDANTAVVTPAKYPDKISYIWTNETTIGSTTLSTSSPHIENVDGKNYLYTEVSLTNLGAVSEDVHLTLQDDCVVNGSVYGGGDESAVNNTTTPANAYTIVTLKGNAEVFGNVFGGGNNGLVSGSTTVNIEQ